VADEDQLAHAATGFEMLLSQRMAVVVDEYGIKAVWKIAESEYADSDIRGRCLAMLETIADHAEYKGRMQADGAIQFLRGVANSPASAKADVVAATRILVKLGVKITAIQDGTTIMMSYPEYWTEQTSDYEEVDVPRGSEEFTKIHDLLNETIDQHRSGYGCIPSTTMDPVGFEVVGIKRLQNTTQWNSYFFKQRTLRSKYRQSLPEYESSQHMDKYPSKMPCLDKAINEYHLWHGTSWDTVKIIKKYGLDPRVSSVMGMFGGGCYFAEDSSKSNQYIPCPTCGKGAIFRAKSEECKCDPNLEFPMVLCRVLLGDFHVVQRYDVEKYRGVDASRPVRRPPNKPNSMEAFDSILGETQKNGATAASRKQRPLQFREYITYDDSCSYPEYLITYRRSHKEQPLLRPPPMPVSDGPISSPPIGGGGGGGSASGGAFAMARAGANPGEYIFTVPLHAVAGETMQVQLPNGKLAACTLPQGVLLGSELQVNLTGA